MVCVILQAKGDTKNTLIPASVSLNDIPTPELASKLLKRNTNPELIGTYKYDESTLHLFGYKSGRANTENKHDLPPPYDKILLFGDSILIATKNNKIVNFDTKMYSQFYDMAFGGFEDLGDEDTDEEEDEEEEIEEVVEEDEEEEEIEVEEEEEEEEPVKKKVRVQAKPKRGVKRLPQWFTAPELVAEPYEI